MGTQRPPQHNDPHHAQGGTHVAPSKTPVSAGYSEHPEVAHPAGHVPSSQASHAGHEYHVMAAPGAVDHEIHAAHGDHDAAGHDKHAGHSVEMFRQKFWGTLLLSIPTIVWAPMIQHWVGYSAPGGVAASRWVPAVCGTAVFAYGGWVFLRGALGELRERYPG